MEKEKVGHDNDRCRRVCLAKYIKNVITFKGQILFQWVGRGKGVWSVGLDTAHCWLYLSSNLNFATCIQALESVV